MRGQGAGHKPRPANWTANPKKEKKIVYTTSIQPIPIQPKAVEAESETVVVKIIPAAAETTETVADPSTETASETTSDSEDAGE